jgi:hypothetical protein
MEPLTIQVGNDITLREGVKARYKAPDTKGYITEVMSRDIWSWDYQSWAVETRVIEYTRDWYHKRIVHSTTGELIYAISERLSAHQGHGAAKKRPPRTENRP